jgi:hypothetical protein
MVTIKGALEAEGRAREFIEERHFRVKGVFFRTVQKKGDMWLLEGEVRFKRRFFFAAKRSFRLQMKLETGEVIFYEELRHHST